MLKINNGKKKVVHFRKASIPTTEYTFNISDTVIERTDSYRYLGYHVNDTLDFNFGVSILSQSSSRALGTIISKHFSVGGFPHEPYHRMYDTLVAPVMDYAAEVWGAKNYDQCNTVQPRAMRTFLGVSRCCHHVGWYAVVHPLCPTPGINDTVLAAPDTDARITPHERDIPLGPRLRSLRNEELERWYPQCIHQMQHAAAFPAIPVARPRTRSHHPWGETTVNGKRMWNACAGSQRNVPS